ncbi:MAG: biotin--[acetyl-CoA-carboxylase] ligase [Myxococcota bacterium]
MGSTNDEVLALAVAGAPSGTAVAAERQTAGRGRRGRGWESLPGEHILVSVLWRPLSLPASAVAGVTLDVGLAVAERLDARGVACQLKWPNDLLVGGKKVGGILAELHDDASRGPFVIIGVGLDVNAAAADFPPELAPIATSIQAVLGHRVDRDAWLDDVVDAVRQACAGYEARGEPDVARYAARCATLGQEVRTEDGRVGRATGIARDGALLVVWPGAHGAPPAAPEPIVAGDVIIIGSGLASS